METIITITTDINNLNDYCVQDRILVVADSEGVGCYKKAILDHSGFSTNVNINLGFYTRL